MLEEKNLEYCLRKKKSLEHQLDENIVLVKTGTESIITYQI